MRAQFETPEPDIEDFRLKLFQLALALCQNSAQLPSSFRVDEGISYEKRQPFVDGVRAIIEQGKYTGRDIALKTLIMPREDDIVGLFERNL